MEKECVFSFDLGKNSLGEAVRENEAITHAASLLIPEETAGIGPARDRRGAYRVRKAKKQRLKWLEEVWSGIGENILWSLKYKKNETNNKLSIETAPYDVREKLEREFAEKNDTTVYTSCLLRILLLKGEKLEKWQIYKALRSALQRRGYDKHVAWKTKDDETSSKKETEYEEKLHDFEGKISSFKEHAQLPCYYDAAQIKLYNKETDTLQPFQHTHEAKRARGYIAPRWMVEKEIFLLLQEAEKQVPALAGKRAYLMYGLDQTNFSQEQFNKDMLAYFENPEENNTIKAVENYRYPKSFAYKIHKGMLAQKLPRFDNRILNYCAVLPKYHVCRKQTLEVIQINFLLGLKNLRYGHAGEKLSPSDLTQIYNEKKAELKKQLSEKKPSLEDVAKIFKLGYKDFNTWLKNNKDKNIKAFSKDHIVELTKLKGRSRFSKPGIFFLKKLILSGKSAEDFAQQNLDELVQNSKYAVTQEEKNTLTIAMEKFLLERLKDVAWENIHVPALTLQEKYSSPSGKEESQETIIKHAIFSNSDPIVRHRLSFFYQRLNALSEKYGKPTAVIFEFIREDFLGPKKKAEYNKALEKNTANNDAVRKELEDIGRKNNYRNFEKLKLLKEQANQCIYTGKHIGNHQLDDCVIDHIIPRKGGYYGSDALFNKVITTNETNIAKADKIPHHFISSEEWQSYKKRVESTKNLSNKKRRHLLVTSKEEAEEVNERHNPLVETSWIAKTARDIACLKFGWQPGEKGEKQKVFVVTGRVTAQLRGRYKLNELLGDSDSQAKIEEEPAQDGKTKAKTNIKKDRSDQRHHALDAMVIAFAVEQLRDPKKLDKFTFPTSIAPQEYFREKLAEVIPQIKFKKPVALNESIYGKIKIPTIKGSPQEIAVIRKDMVGHFTDGKKIDLSQKKIEKIIDRSIRRVLTEYIGDYPEASHDEKLYFLKNELRHKNGSKIKTIRIKAGFLDNKINLSKNTALGYKGAYFETKTETGKGTSQHGYYFYKTLKKNKKGEIQYNENEQPLYKYAVKMVYAFLSPYQVKKELREQGYKILFGAKLLSSGLWLEFCEDIHIEGKAPLQMEKGIYKIKSCENDNIIQFTNINGSPVKNSHGKERFSFGKILEKYENSIRLYTRK